MKLVKEDGSELELDKDKFEFFINSTVGIITDGLVHKFLETTGVLGVNSIVPLAKEYCKMAKFISGDEVKESYDIVNEIFDSDTPYKVFNDKYKQIKIIDTNVLVKWKNVIDKEVSQLNLQRLMFS